jgi:hypothetical protein
MGMKSAGRRAFNPVASAGVDISAMLDEHHDEGRSLADTSVPENGSSTQHSAENRHDVSEGIEGALVQAAQDLDERALPSASASPSAPPSIPTSTSTSTSTVSASTPVVPRTAPVAVIAAAAQERYLVAAADDESSAGVSLVDQAETEVQGTQSTMRATRPRVRKPRDVWPVEEVTLEAGKVPASGRYIWHIEKSVFDLSEKERSDHGIPTWGEYFIAILAQHARELDTVFPSLGYDLSVFGLGVMARRGYRKHDQPTVPAAVYLPRGAQGQGIAEVIEGYAARARSKSAFAQQLVEHHLRAVDRM